MVLPEQEPEQKTIFAISALEYEQVPNILGFRTRKVEYGSLQKHSLGRAIGYLSVQLDPNKRNAEENG